ncbi:efflux RND transporter periplasmic adaptor subunit [Phormidesmis priestleyi ULC007]|uniref:Efflux RND transporter periplasmic adaptor subunit n=1 Tax=Phormidesmis priestleyi ULC007 TaxID=1920490 RepID=A0A2T1DN75_9CYAN|nr:efflux RND transporter periplasmic adaptor subunit [Phormidesmis priestleyi]PSB21948.1 efflux RND transporter periplasmic adaptor subunit [Phormidesmis priestleyi ULC007]PZO55083.1 MAG: efflux RND transporter periplasmic adaptor subunit [Phormidesmis priestleyi]
MQIPLIGKVGKKPAAWLIGLLAAGVITVPVVTYGVLKRGTPKQALTELTVPVKSETVTVRITASGTIAPVQTVNLSPKTSGRLAELFVEQGDRVQAGQAIARMESSELQAQRAQAVANLQEAQQRLAQLQAGTRIEEVRQAESEVARARGEIDRVRGQVADAQSLLEFARSQTRRQQELANQGAISTNSLEEFLRKEQNAKQTLNQAQAQLSQAQAQYNQTVQQLAQRRNGSTREEIGQAEARVASAAAQVQQVNTNIGDAIIRAPFAGLITQRYASVGAFVTPTTSASSTTSATSTSIVALASDLEVLAKVPEIDIGQIKPGQAVEVRVDAFPEETFKGRVRLISPEAVVERDVTAFQVRIQLLSGREKLRSGMNTDLSFLGNQLKEAMLVPTVAIVTKKGQTGVLMPDSKNQPQFKPVTIGTNFNNQTQITEGVKPGDPVFVQLPEGQKLEKIINGEPGATQNK